MREIMKKRKRVVGVSEQAAKALEALKKKLVAKGRLVKTLRTQIKNLKERVKVYRDEAAAHQKTQTNEEIFKRATPEQQLTATTNVLRQLMKDRLVVLTTYPVRSLMAKFCEVRAEELASDLDDARTSMGDTRDRINAAVEGTSTGDATELMVLDEVARILIERTALLTKLELGWRRESISWAHLSRTRRRDG